MVYEEKIAVGAKSLEKGNLMGNKAMLEAFEDIAGRHSDSLGYGLSDMSKTHIAWLLLDWELKVIDRPKYGAELTARTWSRKIDKFYGIRDFELVDSEGKVRAAALSRWVLLNTVKRSPMRADSEMEEKFQSEPDRHALPGEITKLRQPLDYSSEIVYKVQRRDIDIYGHVHNIYYLDMAMEALPEEAYSLRPFDSVKIVYHREIKLGDTIRCRYSRVDGRHVVAILSEKASTLHAVVELC